MQISKEQMDAFSKEAMVEFEEKIADLLQDEFPDARETSLEELKPAIHEQVNKAKTYGLETEQQIANYVTTAWLLGEQFDTEFPAAKEKLTSSEDTADDKISWVVQWTKDMFEALEEGGQDVLG